MAAIVERGRRFGWTRHNPCNLDLRSEQKVTCGRFSQEMAQDLLLERLAAIATESNTDIGGANARRKSWT